VRVYKIVEAKDRAKKRFAERKVSENEKVEYNYVGGFMGLGFYWECIGGTLYLDGCY
jgi:hypothetical protein